MTQDRDEKGRFAAGNRFWEARSSAGRNPLFETPDDLWKSCVEYFEWNAANPLQEAKLTTYQGDSKIESVPKMRAMSIGGLCIFLGIARETWNNYRSNPDFLAATGAVEEIIRSQKFEGAAADMLNANIIARDLGLAEKQEHTGKDGGPIETKDVSDLDLARAIGFILAKGAQVAAKQDDT